MVYYDLILYSTLNSVKVNPKELSRFAVATLARYPVKVLITFG